MFRNPPHNFNEQKYWMQIKRGTCKPNVVGSLYTHLNVVCVTAGNVHFITIMCFYAKWRLQSSDCMHFFLSHFLRVLWRLWDKAVVLFPKHTKITFKWKILHLGISKITERMHECVGLTSKPFIYAIFFLRTLFLIPKTTKRQKSLCIFSRIILFRYQIQKLWQIDSKNTQKMFTTISGVCFVRW